MTLTYEQRLEALRRTAPEGGAWPWAGKLEARALAQSVGLRVPDLLAGPVASIWDVPEPTGPCVLKANEGATCSGVYVLEPFQRGWRDVRRNEALTWTDLCQGIALRSVPPSDRFVTTRHHHGRIAGPFFLESRIQPDGLPVDWKAVCLGGLVQFVLQVRRLPRLGMVNRDAVGRPCTVQQHIPLDPTIPAPRDHAALVVAAEQMAERIPAPFVRVDLYEDTQEGPVFGELTIYPGPAYPVVPTWDTALGARWGAVEALCVSPS